MKVSRRVLRSFPPEAWRVYRQAVRFRRRFPGGLAKESEAATVTNDDPEATATPYRETWFETVTGGRVRCRSDAAILDVRPPEHLDASYIPEADTETPRAWTRALVRLLAGTARPFISHERLAQLSGVSVSTVRRYLEDVPQRGNVEDTGVTFPIGDLADAWATASGLSESEGGFFFVKREPNRGRPIYHLYRRLPNTYERPDIRVRNGSRYAADPEPFDLEPTKFQGPWRDAQTWRKRPRFFC